ncbi:CoA transferase subunit A, partial [candidate division TA06 bacterium]|nr:CoA transferase subunit A [candidate division TA06 bacterium]
GTLAERIRCAGAGIGGFFTPTSVGTELAEGKEHREINGRIYVLEYPLPADYAFIRAWKADTLGNLQFRLAQRNFNPIMATAAKITIVEVENDIVAAGEFDPDQEEEPPPTPLVPPFGADTRYLFSFGPVEEFPGKGLPAGDSVQVVIAYLAAERFHEGGCDPAPGPPHNFEDFALNAFWAQFMFDNPGWSTARQAPAPTDPTSDWFKAYQAKFASLRGGDFRLGDSLPDFRGPPPPPSPVLNLNVTSSRVELIWDNSPENTIDPFIIALGDPEQARDFEGYRIYRSYSGQIADFHLLGEYDKTNGFGLDIGFGDLTPDTTITGSDTLIEYHFDDIPGRPYYPVFYSVTSFDKGFEQVKNGIVVFEVPPLESSVGVNVKRILPSPSVDEVRKDKLNAIVVPNPYRADLSGSGGRYEAEKWEDWDGSGWIEQDRRIQFIHLPARCRIRIYTLDGDLINEINHPDPSDPMASSTSASWNLVSRDLQAIVSGIYLFSCEELDESGKIIGNSQIGKFVVIK